MGLTRTFFEIRITERGFMPAAKVSWSDNAPVGGALCMDHFATREAAIVWVALHFSAPLDGWIERDGLLRIARVIDAGRTTWEA